MDAKETRLDGPGRQSCGHPLAARKITVRDGQLVTTCWACDVERETTKAPVR